MEDIKDIHGLNIQPFDTSSTKDKYIIEYNGVHFEVSVSVTELITVLKETSSISEAAVQLSVLKKEEYSEEDMRILIDKYIKPLINTKDRKTPKSFLFEIELLSAKTIGSLSSLLKGLFFRRVLLLCIFLIVSLEFIFFLYQDSFSNLSFSKVGIFEIAGIIFLYILSSLFHETGHAAACKYFNIEHGGIGLGLYLNFPVFYTDVSNVWKLKRKQRIIVNFAGIYFQLIFLLPIIILSFFIHSGTINHFILVINMSLLITLNPFFKFDGYWIACDLLGVPNLRKHTTELFSYLVKKIRKTKNIQKPYFLSIKPTEKVFMIAYSVVVNAFFTYYFCYIFPRFIYSFCSTFPSRANQIIIALAKGEFPEFQLVSSVFMQLLVFCFMMFFLYKMVRSLIKQISTSFIQHRTIKI
jgi:putative peptide zinc metalloprotease protein